MTSSRIRRTPSPARNYRVLAEIFGEESVAHALRGRSTIELLKDDLSGETTAATPPSDYFPSSLTEDDDEDDTSLTLAIGILRTLLNEQKMTPDDLRRVARGFRVARFGNGVKKGRITEKSKSDGIVSEDEDGCDAQNPVAESIMVSRERDGLLLREKLQRVPSTKLDPPAPKKKRPSTVSTEITSSLQSCKDDDSEKRSGRWSRASNPAA